jgi:small GTP-binding protein
MIKEFKAIIIGNCGVGKTTFLNRLCNINNNFTNSKPTIGINVKKFYKSDISINFWDTSGQEKYKAITKNYLRNSIVVFLVFDVNDYQTFMDIENYWLEEAKKYSEKNAIYYLIANKKDLFVNHPIHRYEEFYQKNKLNFYFISALKDNSFKDIINSIYSNLNQIEYKPNNTITLFENLEKNKCCF